MAHNSDDGTNIDHLHPRPRLVVTHLPEDADGDGDSDASTPESVDAATADYNARLEQMMAEHAPVAAPVPVPVLARDDSGLAGTPAPPPNSHYRPTTVSEIITACNDAGARMSNSNPHRLVMFNAAFGLRQLVDRLSRYEYPDGTPK